jgi:hypothetical protein
MRKEGILTLVCLALVCVGAPSFSKDKAPACTYSDKPLDAPAESPKYSRITITSTSPAAGEPVHPDTVIGIDVEYHVADFTPGKLELLANAAVMTFGLNISLGDRAQGQHFLGQAHGIAHLCAPIRGLFLQKNTRWPLRIHVSLNSQERANFTTLHAESGSLEWPSPDLDKAALLRQKTAPPEDYYLALDTLFAFQVENTAVHKVCVERFPETAPLLDDPFRSWNERNAPLFARIESLQMQRYTEMLRGTNGNAAERLERGRHFYDDYLARQDDVQMRARCTELRLKLGGEAHEFVGRYIRILDEQASRK